VRHKKGKLIVGFIPHSHIGELGSFIMIFFVKSQFYSGMSRGVHRSD